MLAIMSKPTHRETCRSVAQLLTREPWADVVCWELGVDGQQFDVLAVSGLTTEERDQRRTALWQRRSTWKAERKLEQEKPPRPTIPRILVGEVKMSRSDLQAGIRRGQLASYQKGPVQPSHLLLIVWEDALVRPASSPFWDSACTRVTLEDLAAQGVPDTWGVARAHPTHSRKPGVMISLLRLPPRLHRGGDLLHRLSLVERVARSFSYRVLSKSSPMSE